MIRVLLNFLYGSTPATFESRYSLGESIERLRGSTKRSALGALRSQAAVGTVSEHRVVLQRAIPFVGNSFKPFFVGKFQRGSGGIVLTGRFTMHWFVKAFSTFWFGFCLLWTVLATAAVFSSQDTMWWFPLAGLGMLAAGAAMVQLGKFFARNDTIWLSKVIQAALSGSAA
jgi:hypothetical protein